MGPTIFKRSSHHGPRATLATFVASVARVNDRIRISHTLQRQFRDTRAGTGTGARTETRTRFGQRSRYKHDLTHASIDDLTDRQARCLRDGGIEYTGTLSHSRATVTLNMSIADTASGDSGGTTGSGPRRRNARRAEHGVDGECADWVISASSSERMIRITGCKYQKTLMNSDTE